ncbi:MAG: calcium/sodium antiporter [Alphaproteobacteria bacterium]
MIFIVSLFWVVVGLILLFSASELLIRSAIALARHFSLSPAIIGIVLVGFGTSLPELVTSVQAARAGSFGIAIGNVFGSSIANILGIFAIALLLCPLERVASMRRPVLVLLIATMVVMLLTLWGEVSRITGLALFVALCFYLRHEVVESRRQATQATQSTLPNPEVRIPKQLKPWAKRYNWIDWWFRSGPQHATARAIVGLITVVLGARILIIGAVSMAAQFGVSETFIGVTLIAVGTSLPELATILAAARRRQGELIVGNIVGSNIFNLLGILGIAAFARPMVVPAQIVSFDLWILLIATLALVWALLLRERVGYRSGILLLTGYCAYIFVLVTFIR